MNGRVSRRDFLTRAALPLAVTGLAVTHSRLAGAAAPPGRRLARVLASPDRIIRTAVGLRPFRPGGFVVRAERFGEKLVVHNYGHGGGGMTLSWGTSHLAADLAGEAGDRRAAVIGCGAVGLASARLLQRRGFLVTIYARDLPPATTSNIAGATWYPSYQSDAEARTPEWERQFQQAARLAHRYFQEMAGAYYGVRWMDQYVLSARPLEPQWDRPLLEGLMPETRALAPGDHPFLHRHVEHSTTMVIESPHYLNAVTRDFLMAGGRIIVRDFPSLETLLSLPEPIVMNCTGLGARDLFKDLTLTPVKGQLAVLIPQPEIDYIVGTTDDLYMIPRTDGLMLGGTHERGEWALEPNAAEGQRIIDGHVHLFATMKTSRKQTALPWAAE